MLTKTTTIQTTLADAEVRVARQDLPALDEGRGEAVMDVLFSCLLFLTIVTGVCFLFYAALLVNSILQTR